jgi:predicted MFS family arabinose efflux permease
MQSSTVTWPKPSYAWYVVAMLVLAYSFAILDRAVIGLLVEPIKADFGVTDAEIGLLQGLAFALCYTTFGLVLGMITDRANRQLILVTGITVWSISTILCGLAPDFKWLFVARVGVGLGEACILPVAGSLISDYFSPVQRPKAYGIFLLGGTFGTVAGYVLGTIAIITADWVRGVFPSLLDGVHNWQVTFFLAGAPGIIVAALVWLTVREPERREKGNATDASQFAPLFKHLRTHARAYFALLAGTVLNVTGIYAQIAWGATLVIRVHGWKAADVGTAFALIAVVGAASSVIVGWVITAFVKRGHTDAPLLAALMHSASLMIFGPLACLAPSPLWGLGPYIAFNVFANWSSASALMGLSQITPNEMRGQATALYTLLTGLVSLTVGSYSVGFLTDHVFTGPTGIAPGLAVVFGAVGLLGVIVLAWGRPAFRAAVAGAEAWQKS